VQKKIAVVAAKIAFAANLWHRKSENALKPFELYDEPYFLPFLITPTRNRQTFPHFGTTPKIAFSQPTDFFLSRPLQRRERYK